MDRRTDLDILRGILIVIMAINHTPSPLRGVTDQPFGFVSAAEGFVFLSAYLLGYVSQRKLDQRGYAYVQAFVWRRAVKLYLTHLAMLAFLFFTAGLLFKNWPGFYNFILAFFERPSATVISSMLLLYQPPLFDILPLYIVFLIATPLLFRLAQRVGWHHVLIISGAVWVLGQLHLRDLLIAALRTRYTVEPGSFNLLSWQFIWTAGLALGHSWVREPSILRLPRLVTLISCLLALFFFSWRNSKIPVTIELGDNLWLLDKWQLGPLRLVNFFALVVILFWAGPNLRTLSRICQPFSLLGRYALPVFSLHVCLAMLSVGIIETFNFNDRVRLAILTGQISLLFGYAHWLAHRAAGPFVPRHPSIERPNSTS